MQGQLGGFEAGDFLRPARPLEIGQLRHAVRAIENELDRSPPPAAAAERHLRRPVVKRPNVDSHSAGVPQQKRGSEAIAAQQSDRLEQRAAVGQIDARNGQSQGFKLAEAAAWTDLPDFDFGFGGPASGDSPSGSSSGRLVLGMRPD